MREGLDSEARGAGLTGAERPAAPAPSPPTLQDSSRMARRQGKRRRVRRVAVVALVALLVVGPLVALEVWLQDRIGLGVAVAGVSLQGADEADARERLVAEFAERVEPVRLETREGTYETTLRRARRQGRLRGDGRRRPPPPGGGGSPSGSRSGSPVRATSPRS